MKTGTVRGQSHRAVPVHWRRALDARNGAAANIYLFRQWRPDVARHPAPAHLTARQLAVELLSRHLVSTGVGARQVGSRDGAGGAHA
jgi:hypothetical protein